MTAAAGRSAAGRVVRMRTWRGSPGLAAGDLPQGQHPAFVLAFADSQARRGIGEVVEVCSRPSSPAQLAMANAVPGRSGMSLPVSFLR